MSEPTLYQLDPDWTKRTAWAADTLAGLTDLGVLVPVEPCEYFHWLPFLRAVQTVIDGGANCACPDQKTHIEHAIDVAETLRNAALGIGGDDE